MVNSSQVYSATYSNVPVYEYNVGGNNVMRRRSDGWINATHILKVADFDKPARTRILEREVQKGVHEKVQGGYGKYQGTWIPLQDGRALAEKNGVLDKLRVMFDFVPGDSTPPPAPKHSTATSSKPRGSRQSAAARKRMQASLSRIAEEDPGTPDDITIASDLYGDDYGDISQFTSARKRKREPEESFADIQHQHWSDDLLNYFMLAEDPADPHNLPPSPPEGIDLDRAIDEKGNTALHWASAMADLTVVKELISRGASVDSLSKQYETPLMRAVVFTNNFDKQTMDRLAGYFVDTVQAADMFGNTVFHHIALTTQSKSKYACARYYLDSILNKMSERFSPLEIENVLNAQDQNGDTPMTIAARNGARKCVRSLIGRNAAVDIPNDSGQTADELIVQLNHRRRDGRHRQLSSSPYQMDPLSAASAATARGIAHPVMNGTNGQGIQVSSLSSPPTATTPTQHSYNNSLVHHVSEAATALTTQIFPLLQSKSAQLASALDDEEREKQAEMAEAHAAIKGRQEAIETLQRQSRGAEMVLLGEQEEEGAGAGGGAGGADSTYDARLGTELATLVAHCESLVETQQAVRLANALGANEDSMQMGPNEVEGDLGPELAAALAARGTRIGDVDEDDPVVKSLIAGRIAELQSARRSLVRQVVADQSLAGVGARQAEYKRLIAGALNVDQGAVEAMLPDILAELEEQSRSSDLGAVVGAVEERRLPGGRQEIGDSLLSNGPARAVLAGGEMGVHGSGSGMVAV